MREWLDVFKRTGKEFLRDDCMGLAQQVAFSAVLAFFPTLIFLIGVFGLFGDDAFDSLLDLLGGVAPDAVLDVIQTAREESAGQEGQSLVALVVGVLGMLGLSALRRGSPPVPKQAIEEAKRTTAALKSDGSA